jgi:hypothetical protein
MFNFTRSRKGVINGNYYVYFITSENEVKVISFHDTEVEAFEKAEALNNILRDFLTKILCLKNYA